MARRRRHRHRRRAQPHARHAGRRCPMGTGAGLARASRPLRQRVAGPRGADVHLAMAGAARAQRRYGWSGRHGRSRHAGPGARHAQGRRAGPAPCRPGRRHGFPGGHGQARSQPGGRSMTPAGFQGADTLAGRLRFPGGLYGVTPEWDDTDRLADAVRRAAAGGMTALQLRRKTATEAQRAAQAHVLADVCRELGVVFLVNDHWRLALDVGADGAHLGRDDGDLAQARAQAGSGLLLGASCYNDLARARELLDAGADYIAFGAVFPSATKPLAVRAPVSLLAQARELAAGMPGPRPAVVAIGGITPANAPQVAQAGADSIAVINGLFEAPDIQQAAAACAAPFSASSYSKP